MKLKLIFVILLLPSIVFAQTKPEEKVAPKKAVVENRDSTELAGLTKQLNELKMKIMNQKISLYDRKKAIEADEKNLDLMEINSQMLEYAIGKQKELIEAKKK